jgi:hypothetical protein
MSNCPAKFDFLENMAVFIEAEVRKTWVAVKLHDRNWRRLGRAEVKRRIAEAVHSSYLSEGKKTGWVCPDPRQVLVFSEYPIIDDPVLYDGKEWKWVEKLLKSNPHFTEARYDSINAAVHYIFVEPLIVS